MSIIDPLSNRAFLYGEGIFTTLRVEAHKPLFEAAHQQRLILSSKHFWSTSDKEVLRLWPEFWPRVGVVRLTLFKETSERGLLSQGEIKLHQWISESLPSEKKFRLETQLGVLMPADWPAEIKASGTYVARVHALKKCSPEFNDVLFIHPDGELFETTTGHLFFETEDGWITSPVSANVLFGIGRERFIQILKAENKKIFERKIILDELKKVRHVLHVNNVRGLDMVERINQFQFQDYSKRVEWNKRFFYAT
jgi:branched-chain amino acid aminotransferase